MNASAEDFAPLVRQSIDIAEEWVDHVTAVVPRFLPKNLPLDFSPVDN